MAATTTNDTSGSSPIGERPAAQSGPASASDRARPAPPDPARPLSPDSVAAITAVVDGRWAELRARSRREAVHLIVPMAPELSPDEQREIVTARLLELASAGHSGAGFPVEVGGRGDLGGAVTSFEMIGYGDLSLMVKAGVQWGLFGGAIEALGTSAHHQKYLPQVMTGELLGCFGMTESGHGSDVQNVQTTATYDPGTQEFVVHTPFRQARKDYIGNAARDGQLAVVFAQLITGGEARGVHAVLVPIRNEQGEVLPGVTIEDDGLKAGLNGVDNGRISFDQVRVPLENLLDRYAQVAPDGTYFSEIESSGRRFFTMLGTLVRGRISVAGAAGSATKMALLIAIRYGDGRRQFERPDGREGDREVPVLDYLVHQRRLLPALAKTYALHFAQSQLVSDLHDLQSPPAQAAAGAYPTNAEAVDAAERELAQRELETRAAGMKAVATWHATAAIQTAREACGGAGYLAENRLPQLKADTDVFTTFEGANPVLLQLVAKGLLTSYAEHVGDLDALGMVRFLADQVVDTVVERTAARSLRDRLAAAVPGRDDDQDLFDRSWHLQMFADREEHILEGAARRLRRALKGDAFTVFNNAQDHVLATAQAHMDLILLQAFEAGVQACTDPAAQAVLAKLCDLYALSTIEADRAWFLEHNRLTSARTRSITKAVNQLCRDLRPHAVSLVDAFAVPQELLDIPILKPENQSPDHT